MEINFKTSEKTRKYWGKFHFRISKSSTKFHFKVRKSHFELREALFKKGLERNGKYKNVLEFDVEKMVEIFMIFCFV